MQQGHERGLPTADLARSGQRGEVGLKRVVAIETV